MLSKLLHNRKLMVLAALAILTLILAACTAQGTGDFASVPAGRAYAEGKEIFFSHTEASDADIASTLSDMMKSPVLFVPALAQVPAEVLADVYVFENGLKGMGPLGFQPDVFNNPPGTDGYSPLRQIILVKWIDETKARELKSAADVLAAETAGEVTTSLPGVVVNMPFMVWDGGKR